VRVLAHLPDSSLVELLRDQGAEVAFAEARCGFGIRLDDAPEMLVTAMPTPELEALATLDPRLWEERFRRCVEEPFTLLQAWLRDVLARGVPGRWVAITTALGTQPFPGAGSFGACAAALHTLVRIAAVEYGGRGIQANAVAVGWREGALPAMLEEDVAVALEDTPDHRLARPEDVAGAVAWLLSPDAAHVNGEVIRVDGGYTITRSHRAGPCESFERWLLDEHWWGATA
jgi:NAD(P)-dependent dehydrogenase (short-subunit alcohol dehydrogenase family)